METNNFGYLIRQINLLRLNTGTNPLNRLLTLAASVAFTIPSFAQDKEPLTHYQEIALQCYVAVQVSEVDPVGADILWGYIYESIDTGSENWTGLNLAMSFSRGQLAGLAKPKAHIKNPSRIADLDVKAAALSRVDSWCQNVEHYRPIQKAAK